MINTLFLKTKRTRIFQTLVESPSQSLTLFILNVHQGECRNGVEEHQKEKSDIHMFIISYPGATDVYKVRNGNIQDKATVKLGRTGQILPRDSGKR